MTLLTPLITDFAVLSRGLVCDLRSLGSYIALDHLDVSSCAVSSDKPVTSRAVKQRLREGYAEVALTESGLQVSTEQ